METKTTLIPTHSDNATIIPALQRVPEFLQFTQWFATPRQFREPKTQKDFAKLVGVSEDTLTDWKRHPNFWPLAQEAMGTWIQEQVPDAIGALHQKILIKKASAKEIEIFLRLAGVSLINK